MTRPTEEQAARMRALCEAGMSNTAAWAHVMNPPGKPVEGAFVARVTEDIEAGEAVEFTPVEPAPEQTAEAIAWNHRRYAFGQLKATRDNMARDLHRDIAGGKFPDEPALWRAQARLKSYDDLITLLETLKGMIK